ncbi:MAG: type VI secretion system-associated FHA domain protein TagH [Steroidobacteraceae bacterium]
MALKLRVVSDHRRRLGPGATIIMGVGGGNIGRSTDNDWILPDNQRYVSAHHARVLFQEGGYYVEDLSSNGTFLNDSRRPMQRKSPVRLNNGDLLRIGAYQIVVTIDEPDGAVERTTNDKMPTAAADSLDALLKEPSIVAAPAQTDTLTDIGASLNVASLLKPDASTGDSFPAVNAYGQAISSSQRSRAQAVNSAADEVIELQDEEEAERVARRMEKLRRAARQQAPDQNAALQDVRSGIEAFCRGAGLSVEKLPETAYTRMLHLAGQLLRESLVGLKDLARHQHKTLNRLRIELPKSEQAEPFSIDRTAVDDLLAQLLASHDSRRVDAVQWLRGCFEERNQHEFASSDAMRNALSEMLARLSPAELEARFARAARGGKAGPAEYWPLYTQFFHNLAGQSSSAMPHAFVEAFANHYLELLRSDENQQSEKRSQAL